MRVANFINRLVKLYKKTKFTQKLFITARTLRMAGSDRLVEYGWVLSNLGDAQRILDVGSTNSLLPIQLAGMGYDVYSIDQRNYKEYHGLTHPNMKFIQGDIRSTMFPNNFFDLFIAVSTIEHIGTRDYANPVIEEEGDVKAIREIARILKENGRFVFSVPYRREITISLRRKTAETIRKRWEFAKSIIPQPSPLRIYNEDTIRNRLLKDYFKIEKEKYFYKQNGFWLPATVEQIKRLKGRERLACIVARKM